MERLKFFLYSCSNWGFGYFNAFDIGSRYNLDFWVHLGDYVSIHSFIERYARQAQQAQLGTYWSNQLSQTSEYALPKTQR